MRPSEDIFRITVELIHHEPNKAPRVQQQSHYNYWWPDSDLQLRLNSQEADALLGDMLERKARITIDNLLEWRREYHTHDNSDSNSAT